MQRIVKIVIRRGFCEGRALHACRVTSDNEEARTSRPLTTKKLDSKHTKRKIGSLKNRRRVRRNYLRDTLRVRQLYGLRSSLLSCKENNIEGVLVSKNSFECGRRNWMQSSLRSFRIMLFAANLMCIGESTSIHIQRRTCQVGFPAASGQNPCQCAGLLTIP